MSNSTPSTMTQWRLKKNEERRFRQGHPWVFSNELQSSPKGIEPGAPVVLRDAAGIFLAYGFGNPQSLISFRALSRDENDSNFWSVEFFEKTIKYAYELRVRWLGKQTSFRMVYGESDSLPGLVVDFYLLKEGQKVLVLQPHSAGMERALPLLVHALKSFGDFLVIRKDTNSREKEGLQKLSPQVFDLKTSQELHEFEFLKKSTIVLNRTSRVSNTQVNSTQANSVSVADSNVYFLADLITGQKTGFFLDQLSNIQAVIQLLGQSDHPKGQSGSVLDLCCYVGSWSAHLVKNISSITEVMLADASDKALQLAEHNVKLNTQLNTSPKGIQVKTTKADLLDPWPESLNKKFSVVVCDPPALVKSRKALPQGKQAYVHIMSEALKRVEDGGVVVACSCSQLISPDDFEEILAKAARKSHKKVRWIFQGTQAVDHPMIAEFPESSYLKCRVGEVREAD